MFSKFLLTLNVLLQNPSMKFYFFAYPGMPVDGEINSITPGHIGESCQSRNSFEILIYSLKKNRKKVYQERKYIH